MGLENGSNIYLDVGVVATPPQARMLIVVRLKKNVMKAAVYVMTIRLKRFSIIIRLEHRENILLWNSFRLSPLPNPLTHVQDHHELRIQKRSEHFSEDDSIDSLLLKRLLILPALLHMHLLYLHCLNHPTPILPDRTIIPVNRTVIPVRLAQVLDHMTLNLNLLPVLSILGLGDTFL